MAGETRAAVRPERQEEGVAGGPGRPVRLKGAESSCRICILLVLRDHKGWLRARRRPPLMTGMASACFHTGDIHHGMREFWATAISAGRQNAAASATTA